jgi:hypothetical protein
MGTLAGMREKTVLRGVVRPAEHIANVRQAAAEALRGRDDVGTRTVWATFAWALGEEPQAPISRMVSADRTPTPEQFAAELAVARREAELLNEDNVRAGIGHVVEKILEWLLGLKDQPPAYGKASEPVGHLVGGRDNIVRTDVQILAVISAARARAEQFEDRAALMGVIATLEFALGRRQESPITGRYFLNLPTIAEMDGATAKDVQHGVGPWAASFSPEYGQGVRYSIEWLAGWTTHPPVDRQGHLRDPFPDAHT